MDSLSVLTNKQAHHPTPLGNAEKTRHQPIVSGLIRRPDGGDHASGHVSPYCRLPWSRVV